jgi:hypothetical protein
VSTVTARSCISEVDAIVENHVPLLELPSRSPGPEDEAISRTITGLVPVPSANPKRLTGRRESADTRSR